MAKLRKLNQNKPIGVSNVPCVLVQKGEYLNEVGYLVLENYGITVKFDVGEMLDVDMRDRKDRKINRFVKCAVFSNKTSSRK